MNREKKYSIRLAAAMAATIAMQAVTQTARADDPLRISEIFHDGPGADVGTVSGQPFGHVYIELRGTPGTVLNNKYLIFLESEDTPDGDADPNPTGNVDGIFNLSGMTIGSNGFLALLPNGFDRTTAYIRKGTNIYQNTVGLGFGDGVTSTVGFKSQAGGGDLENAGYSAFLLDKGAGTVTLNQHLDSNKDKILDPLKIAGWTIHDSIGEAENNEATAYAYAKTFFTGVQTTNISPGSTNVVTTIAQAIGGSPISVEPEYVARYGSSTLTTADGWMMANITNNTGSGYSAANFARDGFVVSADPHGANPAQPGQSSRGLGNTNAVQTTSISLAPEGTKIQNTIGRPNYPVPDGDLSQNLVVDQADLDIIVSHWHVNDPTKLGYWLAGDSSGFIQNIGGNPVDLGGDGVVNKADLDFVMSHWPAFGSGGYTRPNFGSLEGDFNLDGIVNITDLAKLAQNWGTHALGYAAGDWDYDNFIGITDLYLVAQNWQNGFGPLSAALASVGLGNVSLVPEPAALSMLVLAASMTLSRRRRGR